MMKELSELKALVFEIKNIVRELAQQAVVQQKEINELQRPTKDS